MLTLMCIWILFTFGVTVIAALLARHWGLYLLYGLLVSLVVTAGVLVNKLIQIGPFTVPGGILLASTTFLVTDTLAEWWSRKDAQRAVWLGFISLGLYLISVTIVDLWPGPAFAEERSEIFSQLMGLTPRITLASVVAYLLSQHHDVWAYCLWKRVTGEKSLWLRNNASTIASQTIDTVVFVFIAFYGVLPIVPLICDMLVIKICIALLDTPFIYCIAWLMRKKKQEDHGKKWVANKILDA